MPYVTYIVCALIAAAAAALVTWIGAQKVQQNKADGKLQTAEAKAREIIDDAVKTAENKKRIDDLLRKEDCERN